MGLVGRMVRLRWLQTRWRWTAAGLALVAGAGAMWAITRGGDAGSAALRTATIDRGSIVTAIPASGAIQAIGSVNIMTQVSGQLTEVNVDYNTPVTAGMVVARLDPELFQSRLNSAEADLVMARAGLVSAEAAVDRARTDIRSSEASLTANRAQLANAQLALEQAQRDLDRAAELFSRNVVTQVAVRDAETKVNQARTQIEQTTANINGQIASLDGRRSSLIIAEAGVTSARATIQQKQASVTEAKTELERTVIKAPADGVIIARNVEAGQSVIAGTNQPTILFSTARDLAQMELLVSVDESDIAKVQVGQPVMFTVSSYPGRNFAGRVAQVRLAAKTVQNVTTYQVVVAINNSDLALLPGMTASGSIVLAQRDVLRVPNTALRYAPAGAVTVTNAQAPMQNGGRAGRVFVEDEAGKPQMVAIAIGVTDGRFTEVLAGNLTPGQKIITGTTADVAAPAAPQGPQFQVFGPGDAPPPGFQAPPGAQVQIRIGG